MTGRTSYEYVMMYVTQPIRAAMNAVPSEMRKDLSEVRIRSNRAVSFVYPDKIKFLGKDGSLSNNPNNSRCVCATAGDIRAIVEALCRYSMHCCKKELTEGYFIIENGIRVGAAGTVSETDNRTIKDFSSLNFRIARCVQGCAEELFYRTEGKSVLICGGVNSGKTTILRDMCRLVGSREKAVLIDERNEISGSVGGAARNDVGVMTDVIVGCRRSDGILNAIRTLSPDVIICDEISDLADAQAVLGGAGCGVRFIASIHAKNFGELLKRSAAKALLEAGIFDFAAFLKGSDSPSQLKEIRRLGDDF